MSLSPQSSIEDIFAEIQPEEGTRVLPTQIPAEEGKVNLAILICGNEAESNVIMANLMSYVQEMSAVAEQKAADAKILGPDGQPANDEPTIILPGAD